MPAAQRAAVESHLDGCAACRQLASAAALSAAGVVRSKPLEPGLVLDGKYQLEQRLGEGGMGVVWSALHLGLRHRVAVKLLREVGEPGQVERLKLEARATAQLSGEHVARVLDVVVPATGPAYLVIELLEGEDLAARLKRGPLPVAQALEVMSQVLSALEEAHRVGLVHRDLKPGNVFLCTRPGGATVVKVLDFGIAKSLDASAPALTTTNRLVGSPRTMAPEQLGGPGGLGPWTDVWAAGCLLHELVSGVPAFDGGSVLEVMGHIVHGRRSATPGAPVPTAVAKVIDRCLQLEPSKRPADAAALRALLPLGAQASVSRVRGWWAALAVLAPLAALAGWWSTRPSPARAFEPSKSGTVQTVPKPVPRSVEDAGPTVEPPKAPRPKVKRGDVFDERE